MFKIIILYEVVFIIFWNVLYFANGDFNSWVGEQFLAALYTFLSTMALGLTVVYIIYVTAKLSGFLLNGNKQKSVLYFPRFLLRLIRINFSDPHNTSLKSD